MGQKFLDNPVVWLNNTIRRDIWGYGRAGLNVLGSGNSSVTVAKSVVGAGLLYIYHKDNEAAATAAIIANGLDPGDAAQPVTHALISAWATMVFGPVAAKAAGDAHEYQTLTKDLELHFENDKFKDLWNNAIGRQIGQFCSEHGLSGEDATQMVLDAYRSGQLISKDSDYRIPKSFSGYPNDFNGPAWRGSSFDPGHYANLSIFPPWVPKDWRPPTTSLPGTYLNYTPIQNAPFSGTPLRDAPFTGSPGAFQQFPTYDPYAPSFPYPDTIPTSAFQPGPYQEYEPPIIPASVATVTALPSPVVYFDTSNTPTGWNSDFPANYTLAFPINPIVLDLTGTGIAITQLSSSNQYMDTNGTGLKHRTAWAAAGNGVLVITVHAEHGFAMTDGATTADQLTARNFDFTQWDPTAATDIEALSDVFDTNRDRILSATDTDWAYFKVLVTNTDGTTTVKTLTELGIASINLSTNTTTTSFADGSQIQGTTTFTRTNGTTGTAATVAFAADANGYTVQPTTVVNTDGSTTITTRTLDLDGSLASQTVLTTSTDGRSRTLRTSHSHREKCRHFVARSKSFRSEINQ